MRTAKVSLKEAGADAREFAHNLPVQLTSFIGRDAEMTQVRLLLAGSRLVTLTGAGGVGKTRLALQVAAGLLTEFPAGVWLMELAPLTDASLIPVTVARALGLRDAPGRSTMSTITGFIGARRVLIVLDNCEHLLDACATLAEDLLRACPALVVLATSREPVGAAGEEIWLVPSLATDGAAIDLFADRGRRARSGFAITPDNAEVVAEICRRLDGIPLAIELAAARLRALSPVEIAAGLHHRFRLLTGGSRTAARRQQTLQASVDWSHGLLTEPERVLFRRLAAFAGGFDLEAVDAVVAGDGLQPDEVLSLLVLLVDKSLVAAEEADRLTRYRLPETIRQYALDKLADSGEADQVRTRHRDHYTAMASRLDQPVDGARRRLMQRLEADIDNLRAAFAWSLELGDPETALRLASSLQALWLGRFRMLEGIAWFDAALSGGPAGPQSVPVEVRVRAVADAAVLDDYTDNPLRHKTQAEDAVALARELGDPALLGRALYGAAAGSGWGAVARPYIAEALTLARQASDPRVLAEILSRRAIGALLAGDPVAARRAAEEGLTLAGQAGDDHYSRQCRQWLSWALIMHGDLRRARSLLTDLIAEAEAERLPYWQGFGLGLLGYALGMMGQPDEARAAGEASIAIAGEAGLTYLAGPATAGYVGLVVAALASGDVDSLRTATEAWWSSPGSVRMLESAFHATMAEADLAAGDRAAAREHADQAVARARVAKSWLTFALNASARVAAAAGEVTRAHDEAYQALSLGRSKQVQTEIIDALECIGGLARDAEDQLKAVRLLGAADTIRQHTGYRRYLLRQTGYDAAIAGLRAALGDPAFEQAWAEGAALSLDEGVNYALRGRGERKRPDIGWLSLTPAERDVARLVAEGLSNKEIADRLFVSSRTVQTHLTHMYSKLGVTSRVQLAQQAARHASDT